MNGDDEIDINDLLNDKDLNAELRSLGWMDEPTPAPAKNRAPVSTSFKPPLPAASQAEVNLDTIDIGNIGNINEDEIQLEESDLNDPELLLMFDALSEGKPLPNNPPVAAVPAVLESSANHQASISAKSNVMIGQSSPVKTNADSPIPITADEAKRRAAQYRREGNTDEALKWFRLSKELQANSLVAPPPPVSTASKSSKEKSTKPQPPLPQPSLPPKAQGVQNATSNEAPKPAERPPVTVKAANSDLTNFENLEKALVEASNIHLTEAKTLRDAGDTKQAIEKMKDYQKYQQELTVLRARVTIPHAKAPIFHYDTTRKELKIEHLDIGEENVVFTLHKLDSFGSILSSHSSRNVSVKVSFGLPLNTGSSGGSSKEELVIETPIGKTSGDCNEVVFNHSIMLSGLKRTKLALQGNLRKKVLLEIILHRGFFRSNSVLAYSTLSYQEFASKCEIGGDLPLFAPDKNEETGQYTKKTKVLGGKLQMNMKIRFPFIDKEVKILEERKLIIGPWPTLDSNPPPTVSSIPVNNVATTTAPTSSVPVASTGPSKTLPPHGKDLLLDEDGEEEEQVLPENRVKAEKYAVNLSEKEKNDPEAVDFYVSNDALEQEISALETQIQQGSVAEEEQVTVSIRLQLLQSKMNLLVFQVQNEQLSMEDYLALLKQRIQQDQQIALYLRSLDTNKSKKLAVKILKRKKVMEAEVKGAEENAE